MTPRHPVRQFALKMQHPQNSPNRQTQISRYLAVQLHFEILVQFDFVPRHFQIKILGQIEFVPRNLSLWIWRISGV